MVTLHQLHHVAGHRLVGQTGNASVSATLHIVIGPQ